MILGSPQILAIRLVGGKLVHPQALVTTIPGSLKPESRDPETETGNLETEKRAHRIHGTLETGLHMIPRSLVAPTRGAGGFFLEVCVCTANSVPRRCVPVGTDIFLCRSDSKK